jgi:hypothetical protein
MNSRLHWLGLNFSGNSLRFAHNADYALLRAALGHQRDDSQISLFWLSREGRTALQVRAMEGGSQV